MTQVSFASATISYPKNINLVALGVVGYNPASPQSLQLVKEVLTSPLPHYVNSTICYV
jgi:hypothetical protein